MAAETEFTIGAEASCSDGPCGEVSRLIVDPAARTVTHLVITPKHRREPGRLVPLDLVETAAGQIRLRCTIAEFGRLDRAEEIDMVEGVDYGGGYAAAESAQAGYTGAMRVGASVGNHRPTVVEDVVPIGETEVGHGEPVHALDGEIGQVQGFLVSPDDHQVTHVLLREGHLWGRKEVTIPISAVTGVDDGVRLNITKKQVGDLPPAR
jgi:sporulation protein YlmC with PRC-barrel domain